MALSDLSSAQIRELIRLVKKKDVLQRRIEAIDRSLANFETSTLEEKVTETKVGRRFYRRRRGLKDGIVEALKGAGQGGMAVADLALQLRAKKSSVAVWFYTTGKKTKRIKKVGRGRYAYSSE